jgi:hypothetical protein
MPLVRIVHKRFALYHIVAVLTKIFKAYFETAIAEFANSTGWIGRFI